MDIRIEQVPSVTYHRAIFFDVDDFTTRHTWDSVAYCQAVLAAIFHKKTRVDGLENLCNEWLVCAGLKPDCVWRDAGILLQEYFPRKLRAHP